MSEELEWQTRRDRINTRLKALKPSWHIVRYKDGLDTTNLKNHAVEEYPTANGPADYALFVKGKLLGIIEAKKVKVGPQNVLEQAKRYSKGAFQNVGNWGGYRVPFLYASNGEIIWHIDVRNTKNISRQIATFHTPDALDDFFTEDPSKGFNKLITEPAPVEGLRSYQQEAVEAVESAITKGKRVMLLAMATGTGKTFTTVSLIYRLLEARAVRRILFLVDRRALAAQAVREFASFTTPSGSKFDKEYEVYSQRFKKEDFGDDKAFDPKVLRNDYLTSPQAIHTFVYVSTIQRMTVNLFGWESAFTQNTGDPDYEEEANQIDIPIYAFDLIIADECHRGYTARETATWRQVMDYFDSIKVGLTATPATHTLALFREVIYRYTTEQAIQDGYLVDYEAVKIKSNIRMKGVFLKPGEHVGIIDTETGQETYDELEDEREFATNDIEQKVTAPDSNRKIIKEVARYAYKHQEETGLFPKILIYAVNDLPHTSHCDQLVQICKEEFGQGDDFVKKITGSPSVDRPLQNIREHSIQAPAKYELPKEAVTEAIVNAVAHRDYTSNASVQIMLFTDRLEVWNPGELPPSLTPERLKEPHASIPRNPLIAEPLYLVRYIEKAGSGTLDMINRCNEAGLPSPDFEERAGQFVTTLWRDWLTDEVIKVLNLNDRQKKAMDYLKKYGRISNPEYQKIANSIKKTATRDLNDLKQKGIITQIGSRGPGVHYIISKKRDKMGTMGT